MLAGGAGGRAATTPLAGAEARVQAVASAAAAPSAVHRRRRRGGSSAPVKRRISLA